MNTGRIALCAIALAAAAALASPAAAQTYPSGTVKIVVPYPAGGGTDTIARVIGQRLSTIWKQSVIIDNRPGANGILGTDAVAKSKPDGLTLGLVIAAHAINPSLTKKMPYRTESDFAPITLLAEYPFVMVVTPSLPATTAAEFIALARAKPGEIAFASSGNGSGPHLGVELLKEKAGINLLHVPYKGAAPATTDVVAGHVQMMFNNLLASVQMIRSGQLRVLAVTSAKRAPALPDAPALAEVIPGFSVTGWYGLLAPAGTPQPIVDKVRADVAQVLKDDEIRERLAGDGAIPVAGSPDEFRAFIAAEIEKWAAVIRTAGVQPE
jgi:tripartite-type tricarboxylate transporter receptor subunit TctC